MKARCLLIPAYKKAGEIPDMLLKKLGGITLIERAIQTALECASHKDIHIITDSEEIGLISERNNIKFSIINEPKSETVLFNNSYDSNLLNNLDKLSANFLHNYKHCIIILPQAPLITGKDIEKAWSQQKIHTYAHLISVKKQSQSNDIFVDSSSSEFLIKSLNYAHIHSSFLVKSNALRIINLELLRNQNTENNKILPAIIPFPLEEHAIEIQNYQDWWVSEHLLKRKHVVFVVAGYAAIGMGHVYRALMLAHEINNHKVTFVCTRESELAVESVASKDYPVIRQGKESLAETVLAIQPDLIINDCLATDFAYMQKIKEYAVPCVNFEDSGSGSALADLVINSVDDDTCTTKTRLCGPKYFCLRDEFVTAKRNIFNEKVSTLLITFGGTDQHNFTARTLEIVEPLCRQNNIKIRIVTGPGYAHKEKLEQLITNLDNPDIEFTSATNIMSKKMEGADLAICSAGRTVYELAHMRIPGIILATHAREATHHFGRWKNGFVFAGLMQKIKKERLKDIFIAMLKPDNRRKAWNRQNRLNFSHNKEHVISLVQKFLS